MSPRTDVTLVPVNEPEVPNTHHRDPTLASDMSTRDYFAAHAPGVPSWFEVEDAAPKPEKKTPAADVHDGSGKCFTNDAAGQRPATEEETANLLEWLASFEAHGARRAFRRLIAWRYAYANEMMKARTFDFEHKK